MYNRLVISPGVALDLGASGGVLVLQPPGLTAGQMSLYDLLCRTLHQLREDGPDTGYPMPQTGDFTQATITRDLNIALAQFISQTGIAPAISEKYAQFPVYVTLLGDYPLPADCVALTYIEYTPYGQQTYRLDGLSFEEFNSRFGSVLPNNTGQPYIYRAPYAGYIRLQPMPSSGNASGLPAGDISLAGSPTVGQTIVVTFVYAGSIYAVSYVVKAGDTLTSIALLLSQGINASSVVSAAGAFIAPTVVDGTGAGVSFTTVGSDINAYATQYGATVSGVGMTIAPAPGAYVQPTGDTIGVYYTSMGNVMQQLGDTPGIPPQFHIAPMYRVLADYWLIKQDAAQSQRYSQMFEAEVARGKSFVYDSQRSTQFTLAGADADDAPFGW